MKKFSLYSLSFIVAIIGFSIWSAPAFLLKTPLKSVANLITIEQLSGRIVDGQAQGITPKSLLIKQIKLPIDANKLRLDSLSWVFDFSALLSLKAKVNINAIFNGISINAQLLAGLSDTHSINNLQAKIAIAQLLALLNQHYAIKGHALVDIKILEYQAGQISNLLGEIKLKNLNLFEQKIGNILADISFDNKTRTAIIKLSSSTSSVEVDGIVRLKTNGQYQASIKLTPAKNSSQDIKDMLSLVGYQSGNSRIFKQNGQL